MDWSALKPKQFGSKPSDAYIEGQQAREAGKLRFHCSHHEGSPESNDWLEGYKDMCFYYWVKGESFNVPGV